LLLGGGLLQLLLRILLSSAFSAASSAASVPISALLLLLLRELGRTARWLDSAELVSSLLVSSSCTTTLVRFPG
jgi:hypothetical protein